MPLIYSYFIIYRLKEKIKSLEGCPFKNAFFY